MYLTCVDTEGAGQHDIHRLFWVYVTRVDTDGAGQPDRPLLLWVSMAGAECGKLPEQPSVTAASTALVATWVEGRETASLDAHARVQRVVLVTRPGGWPQGETRHGTNCIGENHVKRRHMRTK